MSDREHMRVVGGGTISARAGAAHLQPREPLLERERELAVIDATLRSVADRGSLVYLEGAAGLGKSRLVSAARERALQAGVMVLEACGHELEHGFPFGLARQLLAPHVQSVGAERERLLGGPVMAAAELLEGRSVRTREDPTGIGVIHGMCVLVERLVRYCRRPGALVAVDDAQWSDSASLRFLVSLAERLAELPVVILVTARPSADRSPLLARLAGTPSARVVRLSPLGSDAIAEMVRLWCGEEAEIEFVRACAEATGGNPFLLVALLRELAGSGVAPTRAHTKRVENLLPEAVLRSVTARLAGLSEEARRLAVAAAILGDAAPLRRAATLANLASRAAEGAGDQLARAGILRGGEPVQINHALISSAILAELPEFARRQARRRAAELLAADDASIEEVCAQLLDTRADADPWVVGQLRAGARAALERAGPGGAVALLRRALAEPPQAQERADVLIDLARAEATEGNTAALDRLERALSLIVDPRERARLLCELSRMQFGRGDFQAAADAAERGLDELGAGVEAVKDELEEELVGVLLIAASSTPAMAEGAMRRLLALIDDLSKGQLPDQPASRAVLASTLASVGRPAAEVRAVAEAALAGAPLVDDPFGATFGLVAVALLVADELQLAVEASDAAAASARARGSVTAAASAIHWRSAAQCLMGRLEEAARGLEQAVWLGRAGWKGIVGWNSYYLARCYIELGDFELAETTIALGQELNDHPLGYAVIFEARGRLALARRQYERALENLLQSAAQLILPDHHIPAIFAWRPLAAIAASALGDCERARTWVREELEAVNGRFTPRTRATVLRAGGIVLGGTEGIGMLEQSVELLEGSPAALELAHSRVELGAALRRAGLRVRAREQLRGGLALALGFRATPLAERAREELAASGARLRRGSERGGAALTPSERRVAELAAQELSVPEIGRRLVLSRKTVEWHLGRVYRKLGVHSRAQFYTAWRAEDP